MEKKLFVKNGRVDRAEAWKWTFGVYGQNLSCALMMNWFFIFCTDVLYMKGAVIGVVLGIARVWDSVNDPLMGTLIDHHRFKNGEKFRPFLRMTPVAVAVIIVLLFTDWGFQGDVPQAIYILVLYLLYDMVFTVQDISMWSMTSVMTDVPAERDKLSQWGRVMATMGFGMVGIFPTVMDVLGQRGVAQKYVYFGGAVVLGAGGMLLSMLTASAKERIRVTDENTTDSFGDNLKMLFQNRIVMLVLLGNILNGLSLTVPAAYFFQHKVSASMFGVELGGLTIMTIFYAVSYLFSGITMFFAGKIAHRIGGMKNVLIMANMVTVVMRVATFFIGYEGNRIWISMIVFGLGSFPSNLFGIARTALWGDSIDYMEWKTGKRAEAITFAAQTFCDKISNALNTVIAGLILTWLAYDAEAIEAGAVLSERFNTWIWPLFMLGPAIGAALYLIPLLFIHYPDSLKQQVTQELKERREKSGASVS